MWNGVAASLLYQYYRPGAWYLKSLIRFDELSCGIKESLHLAAVLVTGAVYVLGCVFGRVNRTLRPGERVCCGGSALLPATSVAS